MHIAVCDDNIADRKQLERLLERESDKRIATSGNLYIDSFGSVGALLHAPMMYDLFLIDYHSEGLNGVDVLNRLRKAGVTAPVVLLSGQTDYKSYATLPANVSHLQKPILKADLADMISKSLDYQATLRPPIAIQGEGTTLYYPEEQIATIFENNHMIYLHLTDGTVQSLLGKLADVEHTIEANPHFAKAGKIIVNFTLVTKVNAGKLLLTTGETVRFPLRQTAFCKRCAAYASSH